MATIQEAYQAACNAGFIKRNEFSEEAFGNMLQDDNNRRAYYDHVTKIDPTFYSKDYDTFSQNVLSALGKPNAKNSTNQPSNAPAPSQVQPTFQPAQGQPTFWQSIGAHDPYPQKTAEGVTQFEKEQQLQRESAATMPLSQQDKDRQAEIQRLQAANGALGRMSAGQTPINQDEIDRLKAEQPSYITREIKTPQDLYTSVSEAWAANTPDGQKAKAELDKTAQDTYNNLLADMNRQIADLQQQVNNGTVTQQQAQQEAQRIADNTNAVYENEMQLAQDYFFRQMTDANADYLSQQARLLGQKATNQTISDINARIAPHIRQLETERQQAMQRASQSVQAQGGMYGAIGASMSANTAYKPEKDQELALYHQSQQFLADAAKISDAAQKGEGFWKGLGKSLGDIDTWDFGISQLTRSANLKDIVEKYEKGEQLTDAEKGLMDSAVVYMSACAYNSDKLSRLYKAGQTTGESIPFMLQFMVMPIGAIKDKVAKGVLGYGIEQFGGKAAQAAGKAAGKAAAKAAAKYGAKTAFKEAGTALLSNLAAAGVQTAAFGVPKIAEGAISRMTGDIQPTITEQGNIAYNGRRNQQSAASAVWNSAVDMYAENLSEMILTSLDPLKAYAGTAKLFSGLKNSQIAQVLGRLNEGVIGKVRDRVQFRNYLEEVGEEYVGNLIRWGLSTDVNNAEDAGLSADRQIDTWLGLAPTSIAFGAANIVEGGIDRFQSSRAAKRLREIMADGDKRKYLESLLKSRNSDDFSKNAHEVIKTVLRDKELNEDTKRLIMDGIYSTYQSQLAQEAEQARVQAEAERQTQPEQQPEQSAQQEIGQQTAFAAESEANQEGEEHYQDADGNEVTFYRNADGSVSLRDENDNAAVNEHGNAVVLTQAEFDKYTQDTNLRRVDRELSADQWAERENELRQQYATEIRPNTHNDGNVYEVALASDGNKHGYIVGDGNVEIDDTTDHAAPRITNSDVVTVRYEDGTMEQVAAKDLNLLSVGSANDIVEQRLQPFQQYAQAMQTFRAGQEVTMDDGSGNTYTSHVVSVSTDGVEVEIENAQGEPDTTIIPNEIALTALHPVEQRQRQPEQQVEKQEPFEFVKTDPFGNPIVVEQPEQIPTTPQKIVPNIDTMLADELGASVVEYLGDKASAIAYLEAERDKADDDVKRLAKQKVTRYTDIADFKRQNDELQAAKKAAADQYNKLQNAIATANNYKTKVEQAAEAERKAREEERRATRRQTQTAQLANAAPAERWKAAPKVEGNAVTRTLSDGTVIKGHYILVEAGAATPSHDPFNGWNTSNGFPVTDDGKNINDRDYKNDTDAQQITTQIAQTYDGQAVAQVPVVSSEGIVYDGNGRTIAGNIAAANNTDGAYIQALADNAGNFGFAPEQVEGMQHSRVYMQTDEDLPYNTTTFAKFNAQEKKSQGSTNRAVSSSKKLTEAARDGMLRILDNYGTLDAFFASEAGAKDIVRSLLDNGIITQQEVAGLTENTDRGFVLSPAGKDYVTDLLIGGLFDEQTIRMLGNDKGLKQSILRAMPSIVENRRLGDYALTDNINNAIRLLYEARQAGMAYPLYIRQVDAFEGKVSDRFSPFEMLLAEEMSSGVEDFRQVLNLYNNSARDDANGQTGLFEPRTFDDIKKEILQHYGKSTDQSAATAAESTQSRPANTQTEPPVPSTPTGDGQGEVANLPNASQIAEEANQISNTRMSIDDSRVSNEQLAELQALYTAWRSGTEENQSENYTRLKDKVTELSNQQYYTMRDMDELTARIDEELGGRADRKSGYAAVQHLLTSNPELGREFLRQNNINKVEELKEWCAKRQYKLRVGKGKEAREAAAQANVDAILGIAHRAAEESTQQEPQAAESAEQNQQSNSAKAPKDEQSKDNGGKEQSQSQQSNTPKTFAQERTDVDLRTLRGAIQIQEIEDLPKDIAPNSLIEVAADDDFGTIVRIGFKNKDLYVQTESKDADGKQWRHTFIVPNARQHVIANIADKFYGNQVSDFTDEEREALKDALYKADTIEHLNGMRQGNIAYQKASAHITNETTDTEIHAITELTEAPERQFAQWVDTLNAGNIRRVAKALNENTSLEAMRALGIAKRAFSRKAREELGDIAKSYVGSTYKLSDVKRVAIAYAADNIYHSDNVPNKETIEAYVEKIYNEAKAARIAELEADLGKPLSLDDKKALIKQISDGKTKVVLVTNKTIVKKLTELGATRKTNANVAAAVSRGDKVKGFFAKGMVILNTDVLQTGNDIIATYVHERQHLLTAANPQALSAIADNATADELAQILQTITGTAFYDQYNNGTANGHTALADELVSHIMQEAYATGKDAAEVAKGYGITNETILQTLNNIDYEQQQSNSLSKARRDKILGRNTQSSSRQSGGNNQTQSQGGLVQQGTRPAGKGSSGTPSRGQTAERGEIADTPVSALSFDEQAKSLKELISFQSKEEEQYFDSILPNLKADKLGVNAIPLEVILQENSIIEKLEGRVSDYIAEHYPTQGSVSALTNSPQGKKEREAMRKDSAFAQLRKEVNAQQDAAQRKIDGKYEEVKAIVDNPSITLGEVAQLWNDALEFSRNLAAENDIRFSVGKASDTLHKSLKSSTFAGKKSQVPKAELAVAYADMFRKQAQGQFVDGNGFAYSANYFHSFENGRIVLSIPIDGNEDYITDYQKQHGTNSSTGTFSQGAGHLWRSQRPSTRDNGIPQRQRSGDERVDRLYGAERTDGASDNQKVNRDTQSDSQTELTDPRFSVSGTQVVPLGERTLVGLHNITSDNLRKVLKAGGLANPSAAVIDIAKQDHHGYGEISLVMPSSLVDSREGNNAGTYTGDMWSPTYPLVERRMTNKGADVYYKALNSAFGNDPARRGLMNKIALGFSNWLNNQHDPKDFAYWYMLENGITPQDVLYNSGIPASVKQRFEPIAGKRLYEYSGEDKALLLSLIAEQRGITTEELKQEAQELRQRYQETLDDPNSKVFQRRIAQDAIEDIDTYGVKYNVLEKGIDDLQNAIKYDGKIDIDATLSKAKEQVQANYKDDFEKWLNDFDERFDIKEYIFDGYTRDGDRKYIPNTLANASRLMNREELQNAGSHGGFNATKGQLIERMNTLADIRANKYRLTSKEGEKDEQWEQLSNEWFTDVIDPLSKMQKISDNPFSNVDYAEQRLLDALRQKDPIAHLNKEYGYKITKESTFAKSLNDLVQRIKDLPAKYFETKFKRPVSLNEFRNAVVPNDLSQDLRDGLEQAGLGLYEYDPETKGSRREATLQATEDDGIRFSIIGERNTPEAQYDELDYDTDNLTDAQQLATNAVLGALDNAGISVERVSEEEAEREVEKEKSESSVRLIRQMAEGTKGQSNNPITAAKVQKNLETAKRKLETATWREDNLHTKNAADVSSLDDAKVRQKIDISKQKLENQSTKSIKNPVSFISDILELRQTGSSYYGTFKLQDGSFITLRLSNHNATVSNFDNEGETEGVSIVISAHPSKGIRNDGTAHIVEYFYRKKDLWNAYGTPLADILGDISELLRTGEYKDTTGLAQRQEVNIPAELQSAEFSIRQTPAPKNTGIGYKVFYRGKDGKLYPPMVANPNGADTPIGVWLNADAAPISGESKTGRPQVKAGGKGTQGGSGQLAYRPGWHLGEIPYALQFNRKDENGDRTLFPKDFVWAEVEYAADVNYQQEAEKEGVTENGKYRHSYAGLKHLPTDGYYRYRTNPNPETDPWIITGAMKVNRVLTNEEVDALVLQAGREPQQREFLRTSNGTIYGYAKDGKIYLTDRGFNPNTPIHEYTHLWVKAVRNNNAELYDNLRDLFSRKNLPDMWDELDRDPQYSNLSDEAKLSEIIARFSGKRGAERMEQEAQKLIDDAKQEGKRAVADAVSFRERMRNLLRRFWNWVGEHLFHIKHFGSREEAADRVLYDILNATDLHQLPAEKDSQAEFSTSPMPKRMDGEMVHEWAKRIAEWKRQQIDEQQVAEYAKLLDKNNSKKSKVFAYVVDKFTPIDNFQQWVQAQGGVYNPDTMDMHSDISLALGRIETFSRRYKNDYMQRIADSIAQIAKDNHIADPLLALGLKWQNFDNKKMNGKPLTVREIMGVYAQAKDTWEADQQGLSDRGAQGFVKNLGVSHTDIIEAVERIIPQKQLDEFWNAVYAANQFALDYQLNAGMIDPDTRNRYTRRYYVPQRDWRERDFDGKDTAYIKDNGTRLYGNPYNAALVKAHGRESLASDPFALIESIGLTSITQSEHNKSKQQLLNLLLANEMLGLKSGAWRVKQVWSKNVIDPRTGHVMRKPDGTPVQAEVTYAAPTQQEREHDASINAQIEQLSKELKDLTQPAARAKRETEIANLQDQLIYTGRATDTMLEHRTRDERLQHQIIVLHDGQQYVIELQDERLANAVNGNFGEAIKAYALFNKYNAPAIRYISGVLTQYNPRFAHRNFWRDAQAAFLNNLSEQGVAFTTRAMANIPMVQRTVWKYILADTYKGKEKYTGQFGDYLREYFEAGAQTGFSFMPELERMAKDFNKMVKGENAWDKVWGKGVKGTLSLMTEASELTVRFAEYVTARQMGRSVQEAAKLAKNISVNFNQSGLMSKEMSKFFTFFNATIQGNMRFLMPYGKNKPKFGEKAFKFGAKFAGMAANFALLGLLSTFLQPDNPDDDTWFTEYDRMSNFILFGKVKIPVVHFFRMFYAAGVQAALAAQGRKTWKDAFYTSADYALGELVPASALQIQNLWDYDETTNTLELNPAKYAQAAAPSVISPLVDVAVNRDFKGSTVYRKKWDNDKKDITTAKRNTPQWAIDVSNTLHRWSGGNPDVPYKGGNTDGWIDIKPNAIEHLAQGYFSGVWEGLGHTTGFIWDGAHDPDVYKHAANWPFLRDLFRDYNEEKAYNQQYYSVLQKLEKYEKRVNTLSKNEFNAEKQTNRFQTFKQVSKQLRRLPNPYNDEETTVTSEDVNKILQLDIELNRNLFTD